MGCWEAPGEVVDGCYMNALSIRKGLFSFRLPTLAVAVTIQMEGSTILFTRFSLRRVEGHVAWAHLSSAGHQAPTYDYQGVCVVTFWATNAE